MKCFSQSTQPILQDEQSSVHRSDDERIYCEENDTQLNNIKVDDALQYQNGSHQSYQNENNIVSDIILQQQQISSREIEDKDQNNRNVQKAQQGKKFFLKFVKEEGYKKEDYPSIVNQIYEICEKEFFFKELKKRFPTEYRNWKNKSNKSKKQQNEGNQKNKQKENDFDKSQGSNSQNCSERYPEFSDYSEIDSSSRKQQTQLLVGKKRGLANLIDPGTSVDSYSNDFKRAIPTKILKEPVNQGDEYPIYNKEGYKIIDHGHNQDNFQPSSSLNNCLADFRSVQPNETNIYEPSLIQQSRQDLGKKNEGQEYDEPKNEQIKKLENYLEQIIIIVQNQEKLQQDLSQQVEGQNKQLFQIKEQFLKFQTKTQEQSGNIQNIQNNKNKSQQRQLLQYKLREQQYANLQSQQQHQQQQQQQQQLQQQQQQQQYLHQEQKQQLHYQPLNKDVFSSKQNQYQQQEQLQQQQLSQHRQQTYQQLQLEDQKGIQYNDRNNINKNNFMNNNALDYNEFNNNESQSTMNNQKNNYSNQNFMITNRDINNNNNNNNNNGNNYFNNNQIQYQRNKNTFQPYLKKSHNTYNQNQYQNHYN